MRSPKEWIVCALLLTTLVRYADAQPHQHQHPSATASPYAGLGARTIKALSAQQIDDLRTGRGMGLALAAELNGYPGPLYVLEHATALALTQPQQSQVQELLNSMKGEAVQLGQLLLAAEEGLDRQFRDGTATVSGLTAATREIGKLQGELRAAHLKYHLATVAVLRPEQIRRYNETRGYAQRPPLHDRSRQR
jgi:hypothetical protein